MKMSANNFKREAGTYLAPWQVNSLLVDMTRCNDNCRCREGVGVAVGGGFKEQSVR